MRQGLPSTSARQRRGPLDESRPRVARVSTLMLHLGVLGAIVTTLLVHGSLDNGWGVALVALWGLAALIHVATVVAERQGLAGSAYARNYRDLGKRWGGL